MMAYLAEGAASLPVFSPHGLGGVAQLLGPTAGYLFAYPAAAVIAGLATRLVETNHRISRFTAAVATGTSATAVILLTGAGWFAHLFHMSTAAAFSFAVVPFLFGEAAKIVGAAGLYSAFSRWRRA